MSALGHKRTYAVQKVMSALPPIATSIAFFGVSAWAKSGHLGQLRPFRGQHGRARQNDPDFGELTGLRIDLN